ncbi:winged helix-turn-helix domain-containing protein, partial [Pseudomonas aeruginosa]|nr:winged helix-turn-helix domain-containing protein [Pseudomonas aeruginosa]
RLEIYTPKEKRVYGYYVLPFLYNGRLVGRVDLRAERARERLVVHALHAEANGMDDAALHELAEQLRSMAAWLGLATVAIEGRGELAVRLRGVLL